MQFIILKYFVTADIVVLVSEVAKNLDKAGALIAALPTVTLLTLFWLDFEGHSAEKITNHAWYTFWYVSPTLPMFAAFPVLVQRFGFWGGYRVFDSDYGAVLQCIRPDSSSIHY